ncbi:maleylpyruvate isomerase N-terminal domain-containing protein [Nocardia sp. CDC153]|uniref:maleylpyruvate isomerase N-terminal domain-containing protein n=1 Tax=Nocardia sp. CDC153 TaxID=3112167 RepID=UPI003FA36DE7
MTAVVFEARLREVRVEQWGGPTPCAEWTVRQLVNHVTRGNLNYKALVQGGTAAEFIRLRDADALGVEPRRSGRHLRFRCSPTRSPAPAHG